MFSFARLPNRFGLGVGEIRSIRTRGFSEQVDDKEVKLQKERNRLSKMNEEDIVKSCLSGETPTHSLESLLQDPLMAVKIRRKVTATKDTRTAGGLERLPFQGMDYSKVIGQCAENVVGYIQIPVGVAGPLLLDGNLFTVPMATTEGALIASTTRGLKAITESGGASSVILGNGMTRSPLLRLPSVKRANELREWVDKSDNFYQVAAAFNSTSRFARLANIKVMMSGRYVHMRFKSKTGDAMGMNMVSKGVEKALMVIKDYFPDLEALSLSGNTCTDKKPSAINWIEGRGKSVAAEVVIPGHIVTKVLKSNVAAICDLNVNKNLVGSAMAGSIGGFNAHASNIVTAIYLATGQDPAQNVESSNCMTLMEPVNGGQDVHVSVTMPSIEVGTIGGGTHLPSQSACLNMMGLDGTSPTLPGANAEQLARVVAATVMAGELSLMAALAAGHLVSSHLAHNRKAPPKDESENIGHSLAALKE